MFDCEKFEISCAWLTRYEIKYRTRSCGRFENIDVSVSREFGVVRRNHFSDQVGRRWVEFSIEHVFLVNIPKSWKGLIRVQPPYPPYHRDSTSVTYWVITDLRHPTGQVYSLRSFYSPILADTWRLSISFLEAVEDDTLGYWDSFNSVISND